MDVGSLERLAPEIAILIVVGYFFHKVLKLGIDTLNDIVDKHATMSDKMNETINKNNKSIDRNTDLLKNTYELVEETVKYLKHRNGTFEALVKDAPALHQLAIKARQENDK